MKCRAGFGFLCVRCGYMHGFSFFLPIGCAEQLLYSEKKKTMFPIGWNPRCFLSFFLQNVFDLKAPKTIELPVTVNSRPQHLQDRTTPEGTVEAIAVPENWVLRRSSEA